ALLIGHVGTDRQSAQLGGDPLARRAIELRDHDLRALLHQPAGVGLADAVAAAGDDRYTAFQSPHRGKYSGSPYSNWDRRRNGFEAAQGTREGRAEDAHGGARQGLGREVAG